MLLNRQIGEIFWDFIVRFFGFHDEDVCIFESRLVLSFFCWRLRIHIPHFFVPCCWSRGVWNMNCTLDCTWFFRQEMVQTSTVKAS
jgi:hypothetical protein